MNKRQLVDELAAVVGPEDVLWRDEDLMLYEYDGSVDRGRPDVVVFPTSTTEVAGVVKVARRHGVPFVPRGAGTGLSGGAVAPRGGITIALSKMNRILELDLENGRAVVQPGVPNLEVSKAVAHAGLYYVPDPSSQGSCTIGGNVAENAGGAHCLAYGVTTNHVLGVELVLPTGEVVQVGGAALDTPGYDLTGLIVGSEGTLGIVTKVILRLVPKPEAVRTLLAIFDRMVDAGQAVSDIIAAGIIPAALEMMDYYALQAVAGTGYPTDADAILLVELEGLEEGLDEQAEDIRRICLEEGAREVRLAQSQAEREQLWKGRKGAFGAIGRISPSYFVQDGVVPRSRLPEVLKQVHEICQRHNLRVANVFHAGDGNLHPLILFDERDPEQLERVRQAAGEILQACVEAGGTITGEHGIGVEKRDHMPRLFSPAELETMWRIRHAFDPDGLCNPSKVLPNNVQLWGNCGQLPYHEVRHVGHKPVLERD